MLNMLVIMENIDLEIKLINYISENDKNVRLYSFCNNYEKAINILTTKSIDFIVLEVNLKNSFGINILKYLMAKRITRYHNSIILLSSKIISNSAFIYEYVNQKSNLNDIIKSINRITKFKLHSKNTNVINKIISELSCLNYDLSLIGTKYLIEVITEIYLKKNYLGDNLKNNIYSILATRYNKSINTIYGDIKHATKNMYERCNKEYIKEYFGFEIYRKPKITEIIFKIIYKIK